MGRGRVLFFTVVLLLWSSSALARDCDSSLIIGHGYNYSKDSYIVIEGRIAVVPLGFSPGTFVEPVFKNPFSPPSECEIVSYVYFTKDPDEPTYCYYWIFKDTATKRECWEYFNSITDIRLEVSYIVEGRDRIHRNVYPNSYTVTLIPVQSDQ